MKSHWMEMAEGRISKHEKKKRKIIYSEIERLRKINRASGTMKTISKGQWSPNKLGEGDLDMKIC